MKKLLKISLLISILLLAFTVVCYADEPTGTTTGDDTTTTGDDTTTSGDDTTTSGDTSPSTSNQTATENITAEFEVKSNIIIPLVVKGLPVGDTVSYCYTVDNNETTAFSSDFPRLSKQDDGTYQTVSNEQNLIQLSGDLYIHIYSGDDAHTKIADIKLDKPISDAYNQFDSSSDASYQHSQFIFYLPYSLNQEGMVRKIHYKIGRITDNSILLAIKNNEAGALGKLKEFAKNDTSALAEETVNPTVFSGYDTREEIIPGSKLVDKAYYYLYAELDDENGKYIPLDSITLAKADVYPSQDYAWFMFFYGKSSFNFDGLDDPIVTDEPTTSEPETPSVLPQTGEKALVFALVGITAVVAVVLFKKNKSLKIK